MKKKISSVMKIAVMCNPSRQAICKALRKDPMHTEQVSKVTGIKMPDVGFHLTTLAHVELITGEFKEIIAPTETKKGKAAKVYRLTGDAKLILDHLGCCVKELEFQKKCDLEENRE